MKFNIKGFTLIELIIVVIIISVLASIAAPMMLGIKNKAIDAEAVTMLGTIRTAERQYYVEHQRYADVTSFEPENDLTPYVRSSDLDGTYFSHHCFKVTTFGSGSTFTADCDFVASEAPNASEVNSRFYMLSMDQDGNVWGVNKEF